MYIEIELFFKAVLLATQWTISEFPTKSFTQDGLKFSVLVLILLSYCNLRRNKYIKPHRKTSEVKQSSTYTPSEAVLVAGYNIYLTFTVGSCMKFMK